MRQLDRFRDLVFDSCNHYFVRKRVSLLYGTMINWYLYDVMTKDDGYFDIQYNCVGIGRKSMVFLGFKGRKR